MAGNDVGYGLIVSAGALTSRRESLGEPFLDGLGRTLHTSRDVRDAVDFYLGSFVHCQSVYISHVTVQGCHELSAGGVCVPDHRVSSDAGFHVHDSNAKVG